MGWPFVWRKTAEANEQVWKSEAGRQRKRAEGAERIARTEVANRRSIAELYAALCDSHGLPVPVDPDQPGRQHAEQAMAAFDEAQARKAADRIALLQEGVAKAREEAAAERRRADGLQKQLDDALGLNSPAVAAGDAWQQRRETRMEFDQPTVKEGSGS